jgi:hypothetical protein
VPLEKREARSRNELLRDVEQVIAHTQREERPIEFHEDQVKQAQKKPSMKQHAQRLGKNGISHSRSEKPLQRDGAKYGQRRRKNSIQCCDRFPIWREQAGCSLQMGKRTRVVADYRLGCGHPSYVSSQGGGAFPDRLRTTLNVSHGVSATGSGGLPEHA